MKPHFAALLFACVLNTLPAYASPFSGLAVGVDGGIIQMEGAVKQRAHFTLGDQVGFEFNNGSSTTITDVSGTGGLIFGYGLAIKDCWILAIEGRANVEKNHLRQSTPTVRFDSGIIFHAPIQTDIRMSWQYGILGKLGWIIGSDCLLYGLIGPHWGKFNIQSNAGFMADDIGFDIDGLVNQHKSTTALGYFLGLGLEQILCSNFSVGLEYNFINYGALKYPTTHGSITVNGDPFPQSLIENPTWADLFLSTLSRLAWVVAN